MPIKTITPYRRPNALRRIVPLVFGLLAATTAAHAQTTSISLRAVPSNTTLSAGDLLTFDIYLDVNSLAAGDNYTTARAYFAYVQNPSSGLIAASSPFAGTPTLTTFTGVTGSSGFQNTTLSSASSAATSGGASYVGFSFSENAGATPRTDTGSFLLARASGTVRSDITPGSYTFSFEEFGSGPGRTFVAGKFGAASGLFPPTLGTNNVTVNIAAGGASTPEPETLLLLVTFGTSRLLVRCRHRNWLSA